MKENNEKIWVLGLGEESSQIVSGLSRMNFKRVKFINYDADPIACYRFTTLHRLEEITNISTRIIDKKIFDLKTKIRNSDVKIKLALIISDFDNMLTPHLNRVLKENLIFTLGIIFDCYHRNRMEKDKSDYLKELKYFDSIILFPSLDLSFMESIMVKDLLRNQNFLIQIISNNILEMITSASSNVKSLNRLKNIFHNKENKFISGGAACGYGRIIQISNQLLDGFNKQKTILKKIKTALIFISVKKDLKNRVTVGEINTLLNNLQKKMFAKTEIYFSINFTDQIQQDLFIIILGLWNRY